MSAGNHTGRHRSYSQPFQGFKTSLYDPSVVTIQYCRRRLSSIFSWDQGAREEILDQILTVSADDSQHAISDATSVSASDSTQSDGTMDLQQFLRFLHNGAFFVFENIITNIPNRDLKALRLCVDKSVADAVLPYMFRSVYFSVHEEDHEVFQQVVDHPVLSRHVSQVLWDVSIPSTPYRPRYITGHDPMGPAPGYATYLARDQRVEPTHKVNDPKSALYRQAADFWMTKETTWLKHSSARLDLELFEESLAKLPNLHRITILAEQHDPCVSHLDYDRLWSTPRSRQWACLPFNSHLLSARPQAPGDGTNGYARLIKCLEMLCKSGVIEIGAMIVESFGRNNLRGTSAVDDGTLDRHKQPYRDFETMLDGFGASVPDSRASKCITLRMLIELRSDEDSPWQHQAPNRRPIDLLSKMCQQTLAEMTYSRVDLKALIAHYDYQSKYPDIFCHLTDCKKICRFRFHECWCPDAAHVLKWLHEKTDVRHIELDSVTSLSSSWYTVLTQLKNEGIVFETLELRSCRSPLEIFGPEFESGILAPWNGESRNIVAWLKGETNNFPLWQGPG